MPEAQARIPRWRVGLFLLSNYLPVAFTRPVEQAAAQGLTDH
jgi:hypothetical protein